MTTSPSLRDHPIFSRLSGAALDELTAALKSRHLAAGEILFRQGDPGDELILVQRGKLAIFTPEAGGTGAGETAIRYFLPGSLLGEMALIDRQPRSASARAEEPSEILTLHGDDFRRLLAQNQEAAQAVMAGLSERIRYTTNFLDEVRGWVRRMHDGNYASAADAPSAAYADPDLAGLAQEFARMALAVQEREELLRREVMQLRIEIDQVKRKEDSSQIMGSDYYQSLKERAKQLRNQDE